MRNTFAAFVIAAVFQMYFSIVISQGQVDPEVRGRLDREFAAAHPQPGDYLPAIELLELNDKKASAYKVEPEQLI